MWEPHLTAVVHAHTLAVDGAVHGGRGACSPACCGCSPVPPAAALPPCPDAEPAQAGLRPPLPTWSPWLRMMSPWLCSSRASKRSNMFSICSWRRPLNMGRACGWGRAGGARKHTLRAGGGRQSSAWPWPIRPMGKGRGGVRRRSSAHSQSRSMHTPALPINAARCTAQRKSYDGSAAGCPLPPPSCYC